MLQGNPGLRRTPRRVGDKGKENAVGLREVSLF